MNNQETASGPCFYEPDSAFADAAADTGAGAVANADAPADSGTVANTDSDAGYNDSYHDDCNDGSVTTARSASEPHQRSSESASENSEASIAVEASLEDDNTEFPANDPDLQKRMAEKDRQLKDLNDRYLRALADYDNLRRRNAKETLDAASRGIESFVRKLLPILDTLDQALKQLSQAEADEKIREGLEMFYFQLMDTLNKEGLKEIPAKGQKFDPNFHEAMCKRCVVEDDDDVVLTEFEKGYTFKNRVLRPSKVEINQK